jgi:uncharacterized OB-fold protein
MTIFCPNCGTANRDNAEICTECGSVIPRLEEEGFQELESSADFGIAETTTNPERATPSAGNDPSDQPTIINNRTSTEQDFGINVSSTSPYTPEEPMEVKEIGGRYVCERCGTVLNPADNECPGCGTPYKIPQQRSISPSPVNAARKPSPYPSAHPYPPPPAGQRPYPRKGTAAKCARCGAIVYDYETRCSNCGRVLAPPSQKSPPQPAKKGPLPPGAARCGRCNAVVFPHHTVCPNCKKPLAPTSTSPGAPKRVSRCRRCGHLVYPTDTVCPNCGRKLD